MANPAQNSPILVRELDGSSGLFAVGELRTALLNAFMAAGRRDSVDIADDIALAVEFTLRQNDRPDAVCERSELDAAVMRLLEEAGYPEVAGVFGRSNPAAEVGVKPDHDEVLPLLAAHLAVSPERLEKLTAEVLALCHKLEFDTYSPHLLLELARHCQRQLEKKTALQAQLVAANPPPELTPQEILQLLDAPEQQLLEQGICRVNGITALFPCVRFYVMFQKLAERENLTAPVTELEFYPRLYELGAQLNRIKQKIDASVAADKSFPLLLVCPDLKDFVRQYFGSECKTLPGELGEALASAFDDKVYKLSIL